VITGYMERRSDQIAEKRNSEQEGQHLNVAINRFYSNTGPSHNSNNKFSRTDMSQYAQHDDTTLKRLKAKHAPTEAQIILRTTKQNPIDRLHISMKTATYEAKNGVRPPSTPGTTQRGVSSQSSLRLKYQDRLLEKNL